VLDVGVIVVDRPGIPVHSVTGTPVINRVAEYFTYETHPTFGAIPVFVHAGGRAVDRPP
jgi:hypothetical protein